MRAHPAKHPARAVPEEGGPRGSATRPGITRSEAKPSEGVRTAGRLNAPRAAVVESNFDGTPWQVNRRAVALVREEWRVVDRWWTEEPVHRRYFDVVLEDGQNAVVFHDGDRGAWFTQRGV